MMKVRSIVASPPSQDLLKAEQSASPAEVPRCIFDRECCAERDPDRG